MGNGETDDEPIWWYNCLEGKQGVTVSGQYYELQGGKAKLRFTARDIKEVRARYDERRELEEDWRRENAYWEDTYGARECQKRSEHYRKEREWRKDAADELSKRCANENRTEYAWATEHKRENDCRTKKKKK